MSLAKMVGDEFVQRPPLSIAEMKRILARGQSISYHGKSGSKFITRPEEIPPIDVLVADGYVEQAIASAELERQIAALDEAKAKLEAMRTAERRTLRQNAVPEDDMSDAADLLRRKRKGAGVSKQGHSPDPAVKTHPALDESVTINISGFTEQETGDV